MPDSKPDVLQGTLDLPVAQTHAAMDSLHARGMACPDEQPDGEIRAERGTSEASFYFLSHCSGQQLSEDAAYWQRGAGVVGRLLAIGAATPNT